MKKELVLFNKITNIFGIALVILGFIPVPVFSQVSGVYANVQVDESRSAFLPEIKSYSGLLGETSAVSNDSDLLTGLPLLSADSGNWSSFSLNSPGLSCEGDECSPELITEGEGSVGEPETEEVLTIETVVDITSEEDLCLDIDSDGDGILDCEDEFPQIALIDAQLDEIVVESEETTSLVSDNLQGEVAALAEAESVLLDENDEPIPLSSEQALQTLSVADPYFTESGVKYCFVPSGSCVASCDVCNVSPTPIQDAIDAANAGTTIYMEEGAEFTESFIIDKSITLTADGANKPVIKSSNGEYIIKIQNADNVSVFDLKLDGEGDSDVIGVWIVNAGDVWLEGNEIVDTAVGIQIDNPGGSTKKVRIYKNTIESKTTNSVGIKINTIGGGSLFASLNTIQNDQYNVVDNSGRDDFELYFNDWGYVDSGGNYQICSMTGYTISDWAQLYTCSLLSNVLNSEAFLDGSLYPDVFDQGLEPNGGLCIAEKNDTYTVKLDQPISGTISLGSGEILAAVGIKSSTSCYYGLAPMTVDETVSVKGEDGSVCYEVTLSEGDSGNYEYFFEKVGDGKGCKDISHMVGYYGDPIEEEEQYCGDGIVNGNEECEPGNGPCTDECVIPTLDLQLTSMCWQDETSHKFRVRNPNDFPVNYTIHLAGSGGGTAPPGDSYFYITGAYGGANTTLIKWVDHNSDQKETSKAVNQDFCEEQVFEELQLSLVCLGVGRFAWSVANPNAFEVGNVQVLIDGNLVFDGTLSAHATVGLGSTSDGPASHTMVVTWEEEGFATIESNKVCEDEYIPPPQDPPIPVTGTQFLIPVTGLDLTAASLTFKGAFVAGGLSLLGLSFGLGKKKTEE